MSSNKTELTKNVSFFIGFDVAKAKLDWCLINQQGLEQTYGVVLNDQVAVAELLLTITGNYPGELIHAVVEATGCYHYPLLDASLAVNVPCLTYNPIITKEQTKKTVRGKKTDRTDAFLIARVGWSGGGRIHVPEPHMATKHYVRSSQKLSILSSSFRQYKQHFTELLDSQLTPEALEVLEGIQVAIKEARAQLHKDMLASVQGKTFTLLQTIPGVGPYVASSLIGEIQDMSRFESSKAVIAYAGLDPRVKDSGKIKNNTGRMTKRGSSHLRHSLFLAANVARRHDPQFKALYDRKRAQGKSHTVATCAVARKLLKVMRRVWLSGQDYQVPEDLQT